MPQRIFRVRIRNFIEHIPDASAISVATKTTASAGAAGLYSWIASVNWIGVISVFVAVVGLVANLYFQRRRDKREHEEHLAKLAELRGQCE